MSDEETEDWRRHAARLAWPPDHPIYAHPVFANQFALQHAPGPDGNGLDGFLMTFGFAAPPMLSGDDEQQRNQVAALSNAAGELEIEITPLVRVFMTVDQARRARDVLIAAIAGVEQAESS